MAYRVWDVSHVLLGRTFVFGLRTKKTFLKPLKTLKKPIKTFLNPVLSSPGVGRKQ